MKISASMRTIRRIGRRVLLLLLLLAWQVAPVASARDTTSSWAFTKLAMGTTDAGPAIEAAAEAGAVNLPCGRYLLASPLSFRGPMPVNIAGAGAACVILNVTFPVGDIIKLVGAQHPRLSDFTIHAATARTSGAIVHAVDTRDARFSDLIFTGSHGGDGYLVDNAVITHIDRFYCDIPVVGGGLGIAAGACIHAVNKSIDLRFSHGATNEWARCIEMTYVSGIYGMDVDCIYSDNAVVFNPGVSQSVTGAFLTILLGDTSRRDNWLFAGTGTIADVLVTNSEANASKTGNGISILNTATNNVTFDNMLVEINKNHGFFLNAGKNISLQAVSACNNGVGAANTADGLYIGRATLVGIIGGRSGGCGTVSALGQVDWQRYGVNAPGGVPGGQTISVMGMQTIKNMTAGLHLPINIRPNLITELGNTND